jgi:hypothetical protein
MTTRRMKMPVCNVYWYSQIWIDKDDTEVSGGNTLAEEIAIVAASVARDTIVDGPCSGFTVVHGDVGYMVDLDSQGGDWVPAVVGSWPEKMEDA